MCLIKVLIPLALSLYMAEHGFSAIVNLLLKKRNRPHITEGGERPENHIHIIGTRH